MPGARQKKFLHTTVVSREKDVYLAVLTRSSRPHICNPCTILGIATLGSLVAIFLSALQCRRPTHETYAGRCTKNSPVSFLRGNTLKRPVRGPREVARRNKRPKHSRRGESPRKQFPAYRQRLTAMTTPAENKNKGPSGSFFLNSRKGLRPSRELTL